MILDICINLGSDLIAIAFAIFVWQRYKAYKFGGWAVSIRQAGKEIACRSVSAKKTEQVLDESSDLSVFIKGVVSPFAWLKADVLANNGLLVVSHSQKLFVVDLDKNPT